MAGAGPARPRVLCLDGGGIRGLSEILILKELMLQVRNQNHLDYTPEPKECFDFICGTSTGGLLAVLLGRLGKTLNECEVLFRSFGSEIFSGGSFSRSLRMISTGSKHTSEGLSTVIRAQAGNKKMHEVDTFTQGHIPVAVIAVSKTTRDDYLFRTYGTRASIEACPIVDACLATSAATTFFPSIEIDGVEYVDGAFRKNNPSSAALAELESTEWISPMQDAVSEVVCLVSVGTGRGTFDCEASGPLSKIIPKGLGAMKVAAKMCIKIATDCHEAHMDVQKRFRRAGLNESYHRFDVDIGLEAIMLNESDSKALQHITSVTKRYLKNSQYEMERCARSLSPRGTTQLGDAAIKQLPRFGMFSSLPECTETFFGREEELLKLKESLNPLTEGRKCSLLHGIGGSGKTQLALQYIRREASRYSAVLWINLFTPAIAAGCLTEIAIAMANNWPQHTPVPWGQRDGDTLAYVKSRLCSTAHKNWLLVIDSADDPGHDDLATYIPSCNYGSVLVTSTRYCQCSWFHPTDPINLGGLDRESSYALLLRCAGRNDDDDDDDSEDGRAVIEELSGIPLAVEQAGGLIRNGEFTFAGFLSEYQKNYRSLMETKIIPDGEPWIYDKNRVVITILDMTCRSLESEPGHVVLLNFLGVLGSWQVPLSLLDNFQLFDFDPSLPAKSPSLESLYSILQEPTKLRLALRRLASFCLIRIKKEDNRLVSFMIHRILCQWSLDKLLEPQRKEIIMQSAYGLAKASCKPIYQTDLFAEDRLDDQFEMIPRYIAPFKRQMTLVREYVAKLDLEAHAGWNRTAYAIVLRQAAWAYLAQGLSNEARDLFKRSLIFESRETGTDWPGDKSRLETLSGYSTACYKAGHLETALESLKSAEGLSESIYGHESEITLKIVSRLKEIRDRQETMQQHKKTALVASAKTARDSNSTKIPSIHGRRNSFFKKPALTASANTARHSNSTISPPHYSTHDRRNLLLEENDGIHQSSDEDVIRHDKNPMRSLFDSCQAGDTDMVQPPLSILDRRVDFELGTGRKLLFLAAQSGNTRLVESLIEKGASINLKDEKGRTPLSLAAQNGHVSVARILLEAGAAIDTVNENGRTPLSTAAYYGRPEMVEFLLEKGAVIDSEDGVGRTALAASVEGGSLAVLELLLNLGADIYCMDWGNLSAFHLASHSGKDEVLQYLIDRSLGGCGPLGRTLLHFTARLGITKEVPWIPDLDLLDVNVQAKDGDTPLHEACQLALPHDVEKLVQAGARCDIKNYDGRTPVDIATVWRRKLTLKILSGARGYKKSELSWRNMSVAEVVISQSLRVLRHKTRMATLEDLNTCSSLYGTPLHQAMRRGSNFVEVLLKAGSHPDRVDNFNQTPLCMAIKDNDVNCARSLISQGANVDNRCAGYDSPWEYAVLRRKWEMVFLLLESGARINHESRYILQTLNAAASLGNVTVCKRLIDVGASWNQSQLGTTALECAKWNRQFDVLSYFLELDGDRGHSHHKSEVANWEHKALKHFGVRSTGIKNRLLSFNPSQSSNSAQAGNNQERK